MKRLVARRVIEKDAIYLAGHGSRDLLIAVGSKARWSRPQRAWVTSVRRGSDAIALAELRGYDVEYTEIELGGDA